MSELPPASDANAPIDAPSAVAPVARRRRRTRRRAASESIDQHRARAIHAELDAREAEAAARKQRAIDVMHAGERELAELRTLGAADVARLIGSSPKTVRELGRRGVLPVVRPTPGRMRFRPADVAEYLKRRQSASWFLS